MSTSSRQNEAAHVKRSVSIRRAVVDHLQFRPYVPSLGRERANSTRLVKSRRSTWTPETLVSEEAKAREKEEREVRNRERSENGPLHRTRTLLTSKSKMPKSTNLSIAVVPPGTGTGTGTGAIESALTSPRTPHTPRSPGHTPHYGDGYDTHVRSPINALPPAPPLSPRSGSSVTAKIFGNKLASKSATKLTSSSSSKNADFSPQSLQNGKSVPYLNQAHAGSSGAGPGQGASGLNIINKSSPDVSVSHPHSGQSSPDAADFSPETLAHSSTLPPQTTDKPHRKTQHKFGAFLNRKSSLRGDEPTVTSPTEPLPPPRSKGEKDRERERPKPAPIKAVTQPIDVPVRTAPVEKERGFRSAMNSALRNRSLDRDEADRISTSQSGHAHKPSSLGPNSTSASLGNASSSGSVMSNIRSGGTRAAEGINKARKGLFGGLGKLGRSGSSHEREREGLRLNEPYELRVLVLPLEEQARITRIAKRLHYCKDKTEFWLPAFPYRCIDYLSDRGTYSEGLYRVPGSELEIKHYMARFDREYDIDLFDQEDLHDVNVVATMLKRWLSNLPPVLPVATQTAIINTCSESHPAVPGATTPTFMKDALSNLPPWNYYLLFAITGHISFLHNHREQNKMTYENLFRCFATRALQVEPYIFWWLVWDWRGCWAGCAREDEFKVKEYAVLDKLAAEDAQSEVSVAPTTKEKGPVKKDSKEAHDLRSQEKEREKEKSRKSKHAVSALSKQSVSSRERRDTVKEKSRPQTAHAHSLSLAAGNKSQPSLPSRSRSPEKSRPLPNVTNEKEKERGREREREISSSDSSKPSLTGASSAADEEAETNTTGSSLQPPGQGKEDGEGRVKNTDMGLPMLSPLKPLSPLGLH